MPLLHKEECGVEGMALLLNIKLTFSKLVIDNAFQMEYITLGLLDLLLGKDKLVGLWRFDKTKFILLSRACACVPVPLSLCQVI